MGQQVGQVAGSGGFGCAGDLGVLLARHAAQKTAACARVPGLQLRILGDTAQNLRRILKNTAHVHIITRSDT